MILGHHQVDKLGSIVDQVPILANDNILIKLVSRGLLEYPKTHRRVKLKPVER